MSRAQAWAKALADSRAKRPTIVIGGGTKVLVTDTGALEMNGRTMSGEQALELATFIIQNFGEPGTSVAAPNEETP